MEEQQNLKRQVQNEREKLYHKEENVKEDFIKKSREFSTQFERLNAREEELSRQGDILLEERAEVKRRCEKVNIFETVYIYTFLTFFKNFDVLMLSEKFYGIYYKV